MPEYVSPWGPRPLSKKLEDFTKYQVTFGFRFLGPHRALVKQLLGDVVIPCYACGSAGLAGTYGSMGLRACPLCCGTGIGYSISLQDLEARRRHILAQYPDAGIPNWRPFEPINTPVLVDGLVIDATPDPGFEQMELPLDYS